MVNPGLTSTWLEKSELLLGEAASLDIPVIPLEEGMVSRGKAQGSGKAQVISEIQTIA